MKKSFLRSSYVNLMLGIPSRIYLTARSILSSRGMFVKKFRRSVPNGKRGVSIVGGSPHFHHFRNEFSGKLLFHLTFNLKFQIFWQNGKHHLRCASTAMNAGICTCHRGLRKLD